MKRQEFESMTLCPLDGRYSGIKDALGEYFSEYALVKYRVCLLYTSDAADEL